MTVLKRASTYQLKHLVTRPTITVERGLTSMNQINSRGVGKFVNQGLARWEKSKNIFFSTEKSLHCHSLRLIQYNIPSNYRVTDAIASTLIS